MNLLAALLLLRMALVTSIAAVFAVCMDLAATSGEEFGGRESLRSVRPVFEFELQHCTKHCAVSGRELRPGEAYFTVLRKSGPTLARLDFAVEHWPGPPDDAVAWWKAQLPLADAKKPAWAPNDVMLQLFESLAGDIEQADLRYVLSLLLVRRRLLRVEASQRDDEGIEQLTLYCGRNETTYQLPAIVPVEQRVQVIQQQLGQLLS